MRKRQPACPPMNEALQNYGRLVSALLDVDQPRLRAIATGKHNESFWVRCEKGLFVP